MNALMKQLADTVDQGEVYHLKTETIPVEFHSGRLHSIQSSQIEGMALRVIQNGRLGFATTTDIANPSKLIEAAAASCAFGETVDVRFPEKGEPVKAAVHDPEIVAFTEEQMIALGEKLLADLAKMDPQANVNLSVAKALETVEIGNTTGRQVEEERTALSVSVEVSKAQEGDIFILSDTVEARYLEDLDSDALLERLSRFLTYGKTIVPAPSRALPVVFTPNGAVALLLPLLVGFNGKSVYMGTSPLKGRIGERAFDEHFSLTDDGTLPRGPRSGGFDDEGTPTLRTPLIEAGTVHGFTYDLRTAALAGAQPTGNGYKGGPFGGGGFRSPPGIGMSNVLVSEGNGAEEAIISEIDEGLLVESVLGLGQGNITAGGFSNNVAVAFKIEHGKVVGRVKNTMIAGNVYSLLKDHLIGLGDERQWVFGMLHTSVIAVDGVNIVGGRN